MIYEVGKGKFEVADQIQDKLYEELISKPKKFKLVGFVPCESCGGTDYEEFEKPHGAPYYRCKNCGAEYMATEVEICEEVE